MVFFFQCVRVGMLGEGGGAIQGDARIPPITKIWENNSFKAAVEVIDQLPLQRQKVAAKI